MPKHYYIIAYFKHFVNIANKQCYKHYIIDPFDSLHSLRVNPAIGSEAETSSLRLEESKAERIDNI